MLAWLACIACLILLPAGAARAESSQAAMPDRTVKAAFIYKLAGYVDWPASAAAANKASFVIGVMGDDAMAAELAVLTNARTIGNQPIQVRIVGEADSLQGVRVLFIGGTDGGVLRRILKEAQRQSILTISDAEGALNLGSVINFRVIDQRVRFEVSFITAEKSNLKVSSRLIPVAYAVQKAAQ